MFYRTGLMETYWAIRKITHAGNEPCHPHRFQATKISLCITSGGSRARRRLCFSDILVGLPAFETGLQRTHDKNPLLKTLRS